VSNTLRFDALLLRALAAELTARLRGMRIARVQFDRASRTLLLEAGPHRQPLTLSWNLHTSGGHVRLTEGAASRTGALLQLSPGTSITAARALVDERVLRLELAASSAPPGFLRALVIELLASRWNAYALGADDVITAVLVPRADDPRDLQPGTPYSPPSVRSRLGAQRPPGLAEWRALLAPVPPPERRQVLLAGIAYTSPLNADWILGEAVLPQGASHLVDEAYERYLRLVTEAPQPVLRLGRQPYPQPLGSTDQPTTTLLAAFSAAADALGVPAVAGEAAVREAALARIVDRQQRLRARQERLEEEARGAAEAAARLRAQADILMANLHAVPRGAAEVELTDFAGSRLRLQLDPARSAQRNAQEWYDQARRRERAARRAPILQERTSAELQRLAVLQERVARGEASAAESPEWLARAERPLAAAPLPYRRYRTSGGLEVRVGRNARANDALTREHASPDDIWLHAREATGAHVVLRWGRREGHPPRQDLVEAATLAAWHSRARTSGLVPVDWTRRKYVRKPRKAPPGQVVMERARTVFVAPDPALERRLREDEAVE